MDSNLKVEITVTQNKNKFSLVLEGTEEEVGKQVADYLAKFETLIK